MKLFAFWRSSDWALGGTGFKSRHLALWGSEVGEKKYENCQEQFGAQMKSHMESWSVTRFSFGTSSGRAS